MKAIWRASFLKSREQADQCNNFGETEEVIVFGGAGVAAKKDIRHLE